MWNEFLAKFSESVLTGMTFEIWASFFLKFVLIIVAVFFLYKAKDEIWDITRDSLTDYDNKTYDSGRVAFFLIIVLFFGWLYIEAYKGATISPVEVGTAVMLIYGGLSAYLKFDKSKPASSFLSSAVEQVEEKLDKTKTE